MSNFRRAKMLGHRRNIERYCRLLATELTELERQYLHKRIAEEQAQLEQLEKSQPERQSKVIAAADRAGEAMRPLGPAYNDGTGLSTDG
jgi:hypothetical protein